MKKLQIVGVALFAMLTFGMLTIASASAAQVTLLAEWLIGGVGLNGELLVEATGELLLEDTKALIGGLEVKAGVSCSGILDGFIGENGTDLITELLNLTEEGINLTFLMELGLACTNDAGSACTEPLVWALNLPWNTLLELVVDTTEPFAILFTPVTGNTLGWGVACMGVIGEPEDECTVGVAVAQATNGTNGFVDVEFSEAITELFELELAVCTLSGIHSGIVEGLGEILPDAGTLTVSE